MHLKVSISYMGMYVNQQQNNTRLHARLTHQLDKHLSQPKTPIKAAELAAEKPIITFRAALFIVLTSGGCMVILLALMQRQNPNVLETSLHARTLALLGLASIVAGCLTLLLRRHHGKTHHQA